MSQDLWNMCRSIKDVCTALEATFPHILKTMTWRGREDYAGESFALEGGAAPALVMGENLYIYHDGECLNLEFWEETQGSRDDPPVWDHTSSAILDIWELPIWIVKYFATEIASAALNYEHEKDMEVMADAYLAALKRGGWEG